MVRTGKRIEAAKTLYGDKHAVDGLSTDYAVESARSPEGQHAVSPHSAASTPKGIKGGHQPDHTQSHSSNIAPELLHSGSTSALRRSTAANHQQHALSKSALPSHATLSSASNEVTRQLGKQLVDSYYECLRTKCSRLLPKVALLMPGYTDFHNPCIEYVTLSFLTHVDS